MWGKDHRPDSALAPTVRLYGEHWKLQPFVPGLNLTLQSWCLQEQDCKLYQKHVGWKLNTKQVTLNIWFMWWLFPLAGTLFLKNNKDVRLNGGIIIGPKSSFACKWLKSHVPIEVRCMYKSWGRWISRKLRLLFMHIATAVFETQGPFDPAASKYN